MHLGAGKAEGRGVCNGAPSAAQGGIARQFPEIDEELLRMILDLGERGRVPLGDRRTCAWLI